MQLLCFADGRKREKRPFHTELKIREDMREAMRDDGCYPGTAFGGHPQQTHWPSVVQRPPH